MALVAVDCDCEKNVVSLPATPSSFWKSFTTWAKNSPGTFAGAAFGTLYLYKYITRVINTCPINLCFRFQ